MTPAEEIRSIRTGLGMTWVQFAARLGVAWRTVARWEAGQRKPAPAVLMVARSLKPRRKKS